MKLGIRGKLFLLSLLVIGVCVLGAELYLSTVLDGTLSEGVRDDLFVRAEIAAGDATRVTTPIAAGPTPAWDAMADDVGRRTHARATFIRADGVVLGDSDVPFEGLAAVENHGAREEVVGALATGRGTATRLSATVGARMTYVAVPIAGGAALARLATPLVEVDRTIGKLRGTILVSTGIALAIALLMSSIAALWASRSVRQLTQVAGRMAGGDLTARTRATGGDEIAALGQALDRLASNLSATLGQLRSERDLLEGILSGMSEGVLVLDRGGRVVLVNAALRAMLLLGPDEAGKLFLEVIRHAELKELLDRARTGAKAVTDEIELGGLKPRRLLVHAATTADASGGLVAVFVDVTDVRRLESLRRDFVANVSHELRTPVAAVRSAAETLRGAAAKDPEAAAGFVEIIERNAERLERLVSDLLDLSRIESREFRLSPEPVELGPVVSQVLGTHRDRAGTRRVALESALPPDLPAARADRRALEQVLSNLVDNAVKYCGDRAKVTLRASASGDAIRLAIEDTGPGIDQRHLPRIFERFYRVDAGRARDVGGTGLGLSIVKHLVEAMGGAVSVESAVGRGSTFTVTLPRGDSTPRAA